VRLVSEEHLRLFRRDAGRFEDKEVHAHVRVKGESNVATPHPALWMNSISKQLSNVDRYARYQSDELRNAVSSFHWTQVVFGRCDL